MSEYDDKRVEFDVAVDEALRCARSLLDALESEDAGWEHGAKIVLKARLAQVERLRRAKAVAA